MAKRLKNTFNKIEEERALADISKAQLDEYKAIKKPNRDELKQTIEELESNIRGCHKAIKKIEGEMGFPQDNNFAIIMHNL